MKTSKAITLLNRLPKDDYKRLIKAREARIRVRLNNAGNLGFRKVGRLIQKHGIPNTSHYATYGECAVCGRGTPACVCKIEIYDMDKNKIGVI